MNGRQVIILRVQVLNVIKAKKFCFHKRKKVVTARECVNHNVGLTLVMFYHLRELFNEFYPPCMSLV